MPPLNFRYRAVGKKRLVMRKIIAGSAGWEHEQEAFKRRTHRGPEAWGEQGAGGRAKDAALD